MTSKRTLVTSCGASSRCTGITQEQGAVIDELFRNRWRTLLSVDDAIEGVHGALQQLGVLEST